MEYYVLGVDGGGTKTELALMNERASVLLRKRIGCTNHELLRGSYAELCRLLRFAILELLKEAGAALSQLAYAVFGLAGADTQSQCKQIEEAMKGIGIKQFLICNDAYLPIKAGCESGAGISSINGTGCTAAGIDRAGRQLQIGGMGELTGDCGGGDYLGRCACAAVYAAIYKRGEATSMTKILLREAHVLQEEVLFNALSDALQKNQICMRNLNRVVFEAANAGDCVALGILQQMGTENGYSVNALLDRLDFGKEVSIILAGSIWQKGENATAIERLQCTVRDTHPNLSIRFSVLQHPPVLGALLWAFHLAWPAAFGPANREKVIGLL